MRALWNPSTYLQQRFLRKRGEGSERFRRRGFSRPGDYRPPFSSQIKLDESSNFGPYLLKTEFVPQTMENEKMTTPTGVSQVRILPAIPTGNSLHAIFLWIISHNYFQLFATNAICCRSFSMFRCHVVVVPEHVRGFWTRWKVGLAFE